MINNKFGPKAEQHIKDMTAINLRRKLIDG
jgi:hypothetical protein